MSKCYKFHGINVCECSDHFKLDDKHRLKTTKYSQFDRSLNGKTICDQGFRDLLAKACGYVVCRSWTDMNKKAFCYINAIGSNEQYNEVPFKLAAIKTGYSSLKVLDNMQVILKK